jgi:hypothetical protein
VFDTGPMAVPSPDLAALRLLGDRVRPLTSAGERTLPAPAALTAVLPQGGLQRGSTVATSGVAATSLALAMAGPTTASGAWLAVVGLPDLGLLAASELGVSLERTILVADPGPRAWPTAVAALLDAVDIVLVRPAQAVPAGVQRRLLARARDRGSVLIQAGGRTEVWAEVPDLLLATTAAAWDGVAGGHGHLRARRVTIDVRGRRAATRTRRVDLWLPGPDGRLAVATPIEPVAPIAPVAPFAPAALREVG